jgi:NAD(P)-dependent dehydrogenase (short-subunit alcohol dehydrogenase family)
MAASRRTVVVTGSTRGIGFGLCEAFLARGCQVVVSGRSPKAVEGAVKKLAAKSTRARVIGQPCDVTDAAELEALWAAARREFGAVDVWINNAGTCNAVRSFVELPVAEIVSVVDANLRGSMLGSHVAMTRMLAQGHGSIFNMEGWGSRGEWNPGMTPYCTTKRAVRYFSDALAREARGTPVRVGTLSPGMVITDLLVSSYENGAAENWARSRWLFNFVIDSPEQVCGWLATKVLAEPRNGAHITWMTWLRLLVRFFQPHYYTRNAFSGTALDTLGKNARG